MATIIEMKESKKDCVLQYVESALRHVRMVEHKLTEVLEQMEDIENN